MVATAVLPMLEEQAKERMKEAGAKGAAIAGKGRPAQNDRGVANLPPPDEAEEKHLARTDAATMLNVSPRSVQTAKKVQQAAPELAEKVKAGEVSLNAAAPYLRTMLGVAISRGSGRTPCASKYPTVVSVRLVRAGLCRVTFTRRSGSGGGTGSRASALNVREHDMQTRNPTLLSDRAVCHAPQCGHFGDAASLTPPMVTMEVFSMSLPLKVRLTQWRRGYHGVMYTVTLFCVGIQNVCVVGREALSAPPPLGRTRRFSQCPGKPHSGTVTAFLALGWSVSLSHFSRLSGLPRRSIYPAGGWTPTGGEA